MASPTWAPLALKAKPVYEKAESLKQLVSVGVPGSDAEFEVCNSDTDR